MVLLHQFCRISLDSLDVSTSVFLKLCAQPRFLLPCFSKAARKAAFSDLGKDVYVSNAA